MSGVRERTASDFVSFIKAQIEAEEQGKNEFTCPLCGGDAWWRRVSYNNHLRSGCKKCEFFIMQ